MLKIALKESYTLTIKSHNFINCCCSNFFLSLQVFAILINKMNDSHLSLTWQGYSKTKEGDFLFARERPNIPSRDKLLNQSIEKNVVKMKASLTKGISDGIL